MLFIWQSLSDWQSRQSRNASPADGQNGRFDLDPSGGRKGAFAWSRSEEIKASGRFLCFAIQSVEPFDSLDVIEGGLRANALLQVAKLHPFAAELASLCIAMRREENPPLLIPEEERINVSLESVEEVSVGHG